MENATDEPLARRARMREALAILSEAAPELGVAPSESSAWRAAGAALGDPVLVAVAGGAGSGKTLLASALGGDPLEGEEADQSDAASEGALTLWKYGFEESDIVDGDVVERYRPVPALRDCAYVEVAARAFEGDGELAERAYTMADVLLLVFSADDPWSKRGWEFLRGIHKRRERPAAAVLTHGDGRTAEELDAIVDYLGKTAKAAIAEELPVFVVTGLAKLGEAEGLAELGAWVASASAARPSFSDRVTTGERALMEAAETVAKALRETVDDTDAEAECVRWLELEIARERDGAHAEAAGEMASAREVFQERTRTDRSRLSAALGLFGVPGSLLAGGGWLRRAGVAAADAAAGKAEEGARKAVGSCGERLGELRRNVVERVAGVFGEEAAESVPDPDESFPDAGEIGRRAAARVREAAGDREAGAEVAAKVGARRFLLLAILLFAGLALVGAFLLFKGGQGAGGAFALGGAAVIVLWGGVLLRARKAAILTSYDRETNAAREAIGRDLGGVAGPVIDDAFDRFVAGLEPLGERAGALAKDRAGLRTRVLEAIELAAEGG